MQKRRLEILEENNLHKNKNVSESTKINKSPSIDPYPILQCPLVS